MKVKHIISTLIIASIFVNLWKYFEQAIYGFAEFRVVDDIIILLMMPFFYITSLWLDEKSSKQKKEVSKTSKKLEEE